MNGRSTLLRTPPADPSKAPIENALDITELAVLGPDMFTNTREAWHPPGARGIFGGVAIAQCIAAGQRTVQPGFAVHSCHCYFLLAGSNSIPITYHVERVRDGRSFATRTVQARQRGACIFTTTMSFVKVSPGRKNISHASELPGCRRAGPPAGPSDGNADVELTGVEMTEGSPSERRCTHWVKARGKIAGGSDAHVAALAYMTDWYLLGTIPRIHDLLKPAADQPTGVAEEGKGEGDGPGSATGRGDGIGGGGAAEGDGKPRIGMMVSLDHSIYFHEPLAIRADEWMFTEMSSPWAGNGRGVVTSKVFSKDGVLLATCTQEGVVRLKQEEGGKVKAKL
ncbi:related to acyl-CoA thiolesterase [Cephalotrichum gorgonifer]|uniref:Related to acyl-CoA thiolesterase n=1 Tax=Cephalotrichum gorgonifer TaxID=2041049 RepID=A0AAE8MW46_9PEZI|nr:related to acyl-CoA thiolesterase [Cephalotrichum gorgonifer]